MASTEGARPTHTEVPATISAGWGWMMIAALGYLVGQVASAVLLVVVAAANGDLHDLSRLAARTVPPGWVTVTGLVGLWVGFLGSVWVASRTSGTANVRRDMGLRFRPVDFVIGPLVGVGGQFVLLPLLYLPLEPVVHNLSHRLSEPAKHLTGGFPGADLVVIGILTVGVVPVVEELVFRGLFLRGALRAFSRAGPRVGAALAIVCTGVVFGLAHLEALETLGLAAFGMVLAYLAYRAQRLGPCILAHASFNLVAVVAIATVGAVH